KLPQYMAPASFVVLPELPLTANGKVDRKKLPAPGGDKKDYLAPRDELQRLLVEMWKENLGIEELGIDDDFFSLNGDSIRGAIFIYQLREKLGEPVHVATIFKAPTIERLAEHLRQEHGTAVERLLGPTAGAYELTKAQWSPLVTLQEGYKRPPLFLVHPVGGNVFCYAHLAAALGPEYTIYGLQARGLDDGQSPLPQIEEMATEYVAAVQSVEPVGPYQLAGWSMGALIAFEMARQLDVRGAEVSFLGLIDPTDPEAGSELRDDAGSVLLQFAMDLGLTPDHLTRPLEELMPLDFDDQLRYLLELAKSAGVVPADTSLAYVRRLFAVFQNNVRAVTTYRAMAYDGEATLFTARERPASRREPLAAWSSLTRAGVQVCSIPGNHYSIFRPPHVQTLAQQLKTSLSRESVKALSV
ncbi:MAG TPA: alpha/beta fold hydrolase, partial [Pyrinomonadaceae bacterium]